MNKQFLPHPSMRGYFAHAVYQAMQKDDRIWVVTGDLGYGMWDKIKADFPKRFLNVGAAEQSMVGVGVGLALGGKIPVLYSITTFLLYRPFETIRNYINNEKIPVKLIGSGRDRDYAHDGMSHWAEEDRRVMAILGNIKSVWPETKEEIPGLVEKMLADNSGWYINLRR